MAKEKENGSADGNPETPGREVKSGADVHVVLASGKRHPAKITRLNKDGTADLAFTHRGEEVVITSSPRDEKHKQHDSWDAAPLAE